VPGEDLEDDRDRGSDEQRDQREAPVQVEGHPGCGQDDGDVLKGLPEDQDLRPVCDQRVAHHACNQIGAALLLEPGEGQSQNASAEVGLHVDPYPGHDPFPRVVPDEPRQRHAEHEDDRREQQVPESVLDSILELLPLAIEIRGGLDLAALDEVSQRVRLQVGCGDVVDEGPCQIGAPREPAGVDQREDDRDRHQGYVGARVPEEAREGPKTTLGATGQRSGDLRDPSRANAAGTDPDPPHPVSDPSPNRLEVRAPAPPTLVVGVAHAVAARGASSTEVAHLGHSASSRCGWYHSADPPATAAAIGRSRRVESGGGQRAFRPATRRPPGR
jgi:hypothetical protein